MFTATLVLTLALGIGACTAIFSLIDAVMLKSLPVTDPSRLYQIGVGKSCCLTNGFEGNWGLYSFKLYKRVEAAAKPEFDQVAAFQAGPGVLSVRYGTGTDRAQARALMGEYVSGNYFDTLGVRAVAGRMLTPADDHRGAPPACRRPGRAACAAGIRGGPPLGLLLLGYNGGAERRSPLRPFGHRRFCRGGRHRGGIEQ